MAVGTTVLACRTKTILDGVDYSGDFNQASLNWTTGEVDVSTFGVSGWKKKLVTISEGGIDLTGFGQAGGHTLDAKMYSMLGAPANPCTLEVDYPTSNVGDVRVVSSVYLKSGKVELKPEDAYRMTLSLSVTGAPVRSLLTS
jgi:hypothetical protein